MNEAALAKIQNLYGLQIELWDVLAQPLRSPKQVQNAQKRVREFGSLLQEVDPSYMGGEDVYESLVDIHTKAKDKLKGRKKKK